jgi:Domain of Unknown Function (DUF1259)
MLVKFAAGAAILSILIAAPAQADTNWNAVGQALGKMGAELPEGVYRVSLPRSDLKVTVDGVEIRPALALGSWLAFKATDDGAMVMGDLVLTQNEVNPVMQRLAEGGIDITALHNHLLREKPATMYMHINGHGDPVKLAQALHAALALSRTPLAAPPSPGPAPAIPLDTAALDKTLGQTGKVNGGVYQYSIPRAEMIMVDRITIPATMGTSIAINFQPTHTGKAAITGDFVLIGSEVNPVLQALRAHGIEVTAIHNHMLEDHPRLFYMHFWADDDAGKLATGLKAALDKVNLAKR